MTRYWDRIDINRVPEQDMKDFARLNPTVAPAWLELRRKYGLYVPLRPLLPGIDLPTERPDSRRARNGCVRPPILSMPSLCA